jgi:iron complex transport system ATP-binding protein
MVKPVSSIRIKDLEVGFKKSGQAKVVAFFDDMLFGPGDFIALVGINGAGKSTLLRSLCGIQPLLSGEITINGRKIEDFSLDELSKSVSIVLTQKVGGFNLKVIDAVAAGQMPYTDAFHRMKKKNFDVVYNAMDRCGVSQYQHLPLDELSDGMFQKTMIARAIAQDTGTILLDEPSAFLDFASKHALFQMLGRLSSSEGRCVVISTHELDLALRYCNRILFVTEGKSRLMTIEEAKADSGFLAMGGGHL